MVQAQEPRVPAPKPPARTAAITVKSGVVPTGENSHRAGGSTGTRSVFASESVANLSSLHAFDNCVARI